MAGRPSFSLWGSSLCGRQFSKSVTPVAQKISDRCPDAIGKGSKSLHSLKINGLVGDYVFDRACKHRANHIDLRESQIDLRESKDWNRSKD